MYILLINARCAKNVELEPLRVCVLTLNNTGLLNLEF
jgi:hypothetical protein